MNNNKKKITETENDDVEEMLKQAEDAVMLKLSVNSHMAHITDQYLDPDLDHRFQTLKSGSSSARKPNLSAKKSSDLESMSQKSSLLKEEVDSDDLLARFSALKASLAKPSSSVSSSSLPASNEANNSDQFKELNADGKFIVGNKDDDDGDSDEVEKVIRWAMDAARLDPSPLSDDDDVDDLLSYDSGDDDNDDSSGEEDCDNRKKNKQRDTKKYGGMKGR